MKILIDILIFLIGIICGIAALATCDEHSFELFMKLRKTFNTLNGDNDE